MIRFSLPAFWMALLFAPSLAHAGVEDIYVQGNYHLEHRYSKNESATDILGGIDFRPFALLPVMIGPRIGYYRMETLRQFSAARNKFGFGIQTFALLQPFGLVGIKGGAAVDFFNGDSDHKLHMYTGLLAGLRFKPLIPIYIEVPFEVGYFPNLNDKIYMYKIGLQLGVQF